MMIGEPRQHTHPTVQIPPWPLLDDPTDENDLLSPYSLYNYNTTPTTNSTDTNTCADFAAVNSPSYRVQDIFASLQRYLPSNNVQDGDFDPDAPLDAYSCDHFRMYEFKVRKCVRGRAHDWTECPYAHPGEKARRRDPRKYHYSGTACPDFRKGNCRKGDACEYAHGVFECWLHPARYRTQPCKDGSNCRRRVCFFAHTQEQLRLVTPHSPVEASRARTLPFLGSPSTDSPDESPPMTPTLSRSFGSGYGSGSSSVSEMMVSLRNLQLVDKAKALHGSWNMHVSESGSGYGSPRRSVFRPVFSSLPTTPSDGMTRVGYSDFWERGCEEEPVMERVESGRGLRVKLFEKLSKENIGTSDPGGAPDVGWVSDLVQ